MCAAILEPNSRVEARGSPEQMKTEGKTPEWCLPRHLVSLLKILITQDGIGGFDHRTCLQRYFWGRGWPPARTDCSRRTRLSVVS